MKRNIPFVETVTHKAQGRSNVLDGVTKVDIFGTQYTIKGDADPEYISEIAGFLNQKMADVSAQLTSANPINVALLAALNIVDEYFQHKALCEREFSKVERKTQKMIDILDQGIIGDTY